MAKKVKTKFLFPSTPKDHIRQLIEWMSQGVYEKEHIIAVALSYNKPHLVDNQWFSYIFINWRTAAPQLSYNKPHLVDYQRFSYIFLNWRTAAPQLSYNKPYLVDYQQFSYIFFKLAHSGTTTII